MKLFPKRVAPNTNYLSGPLPLDELKFILNRLVPPVTRGTKGESFGLTETGGGMAWTTYPYENAVLVFTFRFTLDANSLKLSEPVTFSPEEISTALKQPKTPSL